MVISQVDQPKSVEDLTHIASAASLRLRLTQFYLVTPSASSSVAAEAHVRHRPAVALTRLVDDNIATARPVFRDMVQARLVAFACHEETTGRCPFP
jgi:hypothetical protein